MKHKTPKQLIAELARAQAAFDRALESYGRSKERLEQVETRAATQRGMLTLAKSWTRVGDAAHRIGAAMQACVEDQRRCDREEVAA
jgi:hypothetical protein